MYIYIYIHIHIYIYIHKHTYIHTYIHTCMHTYIRKPHRDFLAQKAYHGPQFNGMCVKHRGVRFHRTRGEFKQYYFGSVPPTSQRKDEVLAGRPSLMRIGAARGQSPPSRLLLGTGKIERARRLCQAPARKKWGEFEGVPGAFSEPRDPFFRAGGSATITNGHYVYIYIYIYVLLSLFSL